MPYIILFVYIKTLKNMKNLYFRVGYNDYGSWFTYNNSASDHNGINKWTWEGYYLEPFIGKINY